MQIKACGTGYLCFITIETNGKVYFPNGFFPILHTLRILYVLTAGSGKPV
jgi:hypothetical protein